MGVKEGFTEDVSLALEFKWLGEEVLWAEGSGYEKSETGDLVRHSGKYGSLTTLTESPDKRTYTRMSTNTHAHLLSRPLA